MIDLARRNADYLALSALLPLAAWALGRTSGAIGAVLGLVTAGMVIWSNALIVRAMGPDAGRAGSSAVMGIALLLKLPVLGVCIALVTAFPVGHFGWFLAGVGLVYSLVLRRAFHSVRGEHGRTSAHD